MDKCLLYVIGTSSAFPLGLENLEVWEGIFQSGKSRGIFEQTGKVRENYTKYWKIQILFVIFFSDI